MAPAGASCLALLVLACALLLSGVSGELLSRGFRLAPPPPLAPSRRPVRMVTGHGVMGGYRWIGLGSGAPGEWCRRPSWCHPMH